MTKSKMTKILLLLGFLVFFLVFFGSALGARSRTMNLYLSGIKSLEDGNYQEAIDILERLGDYQDTRQYIETAKDCIKKQDEENARLYNEGTLYFEKENYVRALSIFEQLEGYNDSNGLALECRTMLKRLALSSTISAGTLNSASIMKDGHVSFVGQSFDEKSIIQDWDNIVSIAVGNEFTAAIKNDGTVVTAKRKTSYPYHIDTSSWTDIIAISVGGEFIIGLKADGTLIAEGRNSCGETDIDNWTDIIAIDSGWNHTIGLDKNGKIYITGHTSSLVSSINERRNEWKDIIAISAGGGIRQGTQQTGHVVALRKDGRVVAVGDNSYGQCNVNDWTDIIAISAGDYHTVGLTSDGHVLTTQIGENSSDIFAEISSWKNIVAISAGYGFTLGLKDDGTVVAAGCNMEGQWDTTLLSRAVVRSEWRFILENLE